MRALLDNDLLVRAAISQGGGAYRALERWKQGDFVLLRSNALKAELIDVLGRAHLNPRLSADEAEGFLALLERRAEVVDTTGVEIRLCRDPKDDKILEAAVAGHADLIVTTDGDLLALREVQGIPIVHLYAFLDTLGVPRP